MVVGGKPDVGGMAPRFNVGICGMGGNELKSAGKVPKNKISIIICVKNKLARLLYDVLIHIADLNYFLKL